MSFTLLVVDDEPDIFTITRLALRGLRLKEQEVRIEAVYSAEEARAYLTKHPETAVILLDVVMESEHAGLEFCDWLRQRNKHTRILLRTGQPGAAPEREVIDTYEIDGYLAKAEMTKNRLYSAVKSALRTFDELHHAITLEQSLHYLHQLALDLGDQTSEERLQSLVEAACSLSDSDLALLYLQQDGKEPRLLFSSTLDDPNARVDEVLQELSGDTPTLTGTTLPIEIKDGVGWFYLDRALHQDPVAQKILPLLGAHAARAVS